MKHLLSCIFFLFFASVLPGVEVDKKDVFEISMSGDIDDDLIIIKASPDEVKIEDIMQMHNPTGMFRYDGAIYKSEHIPGAIDFKKIYTIEDNKIYIVVLANERMEAHLQERVRTHYKSERLDINAEQFLPALMPEYVSVADYPLWFAEDEIPMVQRDDVNGAQYNYYHLFDNSTVLTGLVFPAVGKAVIKLYDKHDKLLHTFNSLISNSGPTRLISNEEARGELSDHPFTEVGNILNNKEGVEIQNDNYISNMVVEYNNKTYLIPLPFPIMYPNLIYGVALP